MQKSGKNNQIGNSSKIAIIGGGPAGSLFALYVRRWADERGIHPEITIYEQRNFNNLGIKGCKGCAGILSANFSQKIAELELTVPEEIIQSTISRYAVHSPYTSISISKPEKEIKIVSVYRGGGPRISNFEKQVSFNGWLLNEARRRDVKVEEQVVSGIFLGREARIQTTDHLLEYDLVVLASGINCKQIEVRGVHYIPPATQTMSQCELYLGHDRPKSIQDNTAHVFLVPNSDIIFGTLVPKGPFINVSVLSKGASPYPAREFLKLDLVRNILPGKFEYSCSCRPKVATGLVRNCYTDKFVAIGDASVARLYKDGIGSALSTAREAARCVINGGTSSSDFKRKYYPLCRRIHWGNRWGRLLFFINDKVKNSRTFLLTQNRLIGNEQDNIKLSQPFTKAAWGMFSGTYSYQIIARMTLNPLSLARMLMVFVKESPQKFKRKGISHTRKLYVGNQKILILGSGFGGTHVFRHLLPSLNQNENVETTMISDENYFLFTPLLHEVAMGKIETRHVAFPIRRLHWKDRFNFVQDKVQKIDLLRHQVYTSRHVYDFDYLVLALGSITDVSRLKAPGNNVFTLKTLQDAILIRNHLIGIFERVVTENSPEKRQEMLTFLVCGAGYTGVQLVTELRDFIYHHLARFYKSIDKREIKIILIEAEPKILSGLPAKLCAYASTQLQSMGIEIKLNSRVTDVKDNRVEVNGSEYISAHTLIWVAGVVANPLIAGLDVEKDNIGRVIVNQFMEIPEAPGLFGVGDCASFVDPVSGQTVPPRAHNAVRQARVVAHNILAEIRGWDKKPYHYSDTAEAISLGASKAVFRFYNLKLSGFLARLIWIAGYSLLVTGTYNRFSILADWGLSFLFGRDTTYLKLPK